MGLTGQRFNNWNPLLAMDVLLDGVKYVVES